MKEAVGRTARLVRTLRRRPAASPPVDGVGVGVGGTVTSPEPSVEDWARYGGGLSAADLTPDQGRSQSSVHVLST